MPLELDETKIDESRTRTALSQLRPKDPSSVEVTELGRDGSTLSERIHLRSGRKSEISGDDRRGGSQGATASADVVRHVRICHPRV